MSKSSKRRRLSRTSLSLFLSLFLVSWVVVDSGPAPAAASASTRVSVPDPSTGQTVGNDRSTSTSISDDARWVAYVSDASNLVNGDTNNAGDIFVHDRQLGTTERVNVPDPSTGHTQANAHSWDVSIRGDGNRVAIQSSATNLVVGDSNHRSDIFIVDRVAGTTELVSVDALGVPNGASDIFTQYVHQRPHLSGDGRYVGWESTKRFFGLPRWSRVYVRDLLTGTTELVSQSTAGNVGNNFSLAANVSYDGHYVAFSSSSTNLVPGNTNLNKTDVFVRDRVAGTTERVSVNSQGDLGNLASVMPLSGRGYTMTQDGRYVVFRSRATNLVDNDTNSTWDAFIHDRQTGTTERVSESTGGVFESDGQTQVVTISLDGRFVSFQSFAKSLDDADTDDYWDTYLHDRQTDVTAVVSVNGNGEPANSAFLDDPAISGDGSQVVYHTRADNLDVADTNGTNDVYIAATAGATVPEPDMTSSITLDAPLERGTLDSFVVTPKNVGSLDATGPITVTIGLPAELTLVQASGTNWNCIGDTCTAPGPVGTFSPADPITVDVNVDAGAPDPVAVSATVGCSCADARPANDVVVENLAVRDAAPAGADHVDLSVTGIGGSYFLNDFTYSGDIAITYDAGNNLRNVSGEAEVPSPTGVGDATVRFAVSKDPNTGLVSGQVVVHDAAANAHYSTPMFGGQLYSSSYGVVVGSKSWVNFSSWPWRSYRTTFEVIDNDL